MVREGFIYKVKLDCFGFYYFSPSLILNVFLTFRWYLMVILKTVGFREKKKKKNMFLS